MHNHADENDSPAHEYARNVARLFSAMGQPVSRKTTVAPFWGNNTYPEGGWTFQVSKVKPNSIQIRAFADGNVARNVNPTAAWKHERLASFQKFVRIVTGTSLTEANDRNVDCWLEDSVNGVLGQLAKLQIDDLVYMWDRLIGEVTFVSEKPEPAPEPAPEPTYVVPLTLRADATVPTPIEAGKQFRRVLETTDKERARKPGPMPYAEAWSLVRDAGYALLEAMGL